MSGEFGDYGSGGYMHDKILKAIDDCADGHYCYTQAFGGVLEAVRSLARDISYCEAGDSSMDSNLKPKHLEAIKTTIFILEEYEKVIRNYKEK
jgi:hypothetical protein